MRAVTYVAFYAMNTGLVLLGAAGMIAPGWDFRTQLGIASLESLDTVQRRTLLVQYRYLKAFALALGVMGFVFRDEIFADHAVNGIYVGFLAIAVVARVLGLLMDGPPNRLLTYVIIPFEAAVPLLVYLYSRQTLGS